MVLFGPDVSNYQPGIDMARVAAEGHSFVIAKVSQGSGYRSPSWPTQRDAARAHGLLLAGYHFIDTSPAGAQATNCKAHLGDPAIPLALDWETGSGNWANFLAVLSAFRAAGLNVRLAYCPRWYAQQQGSPDMTAAGIPLWSSRYVTGGGTPAQLYPKVTAEQWAGYGGLQVALVQFTDSATVAGMSIDCSAYLGTRDQLAALLGDTTPAAAPIPREDEPVTVIPITPDQAGNFKSLVMAEVGDASAVIARAWVTAGAAWTGKTAHIIITALDDGGGVLAQKTFDPGNNRRIVVELPNKTVMATVEGNTGGAVVAAALITQPK